MPQTGEAARLAAAKRAIIEVHAGFTYIGDPQKFKIPEHWRSYLQEVLAGDLWDDDCDAFGMTGVDLLLYRDIANPEELALHTCKVDRWSDQLYDHLCGSVDIGGVTWMVDCRVPYLVPMTHLRYSWHSHIRYGDFANNGWRHTVMT